MSENKQPFDKQDENVNSTTAGPSVRPAGTGRRVAYAALAVGALGAVAGAVAAAFTGKGVGDGVKAIVEGAADTVKGVAEGVKATIIEGAVDTVKGVADGVKPTIEDAADAVKGVADGVKPTVEGDVTMVHGGHDAGGVCATVEKERVVVERTPPVDAVRPVAPGAVDFQEEKVARRMEVEKQTDEIPTLPKSLDAPAATGAGHGAAFNATHSVANGATPNAANDVTNTTALVQMLLHQTATEVAMSYYEQLPAVVFAEIQRLATNPTPEEKQRIRDSWAKALEPLAMAIVLSGQSFNLGAAPAASNGHHMQLNQLNGSSDRNR